MKPIPTKKIQSPSLIWIKAVLGCCDSIAELQHQQTGMTSRCSFDHFVGKNKQQRRDARRSTVVSVVRVRNGRSGGALGLFLPRF
jgi:hypothetical protein